MRAGAMSPGCGRSSSRTAPNLATRWSGQRCGTLVEPTIGDTIKGTSEGCRSVLTIPVAAADPAAGQVPKCPTNALVVGGSEKVLRETVHLVRQNGRAAGATNDFNNVLALFDGAALDIVVFGGMVPPATKE